MNDLFEEKVNITYLDLDKTIKFVVVEFQYKRYLRDIELVNLILRLSKSDPILAVLFIFVVSSKPVKELS